jgi:hypothetical protein
MDSTFSTRMAWAAGTHVVAVALLTPLTGRLAVASHRIPDYQP